MTEEQGILWKKIQEFDIDDNDSDFTFTDRLARENGWTIAYAVRCIEEYKKFIFLICMANTRLTPSDQVDQVWHLHLLYTESYWTELCKNIIQREIHHGPTKGGGKERAMYNSLYEETKRLYHIAFENEAPKDIWPSNDVRFGELNFRRVNTHRNWIVPKFRTKLWKN